jgi:nucleoside-diphosphate-sugar epimerase
MPTTQPTGPHVVIGASGGIGGSIVEALVRRGLPVRAVSRSPQPGRDGVEPFEADVTDPEQARQAVAGAAVVYHAAMPPYTRWPEEFPALNDSIIAAVEQVGAPLVYVDNLYMYGPGAGVMTETTPQHATDRKGVTRKRLSAELLEAHAAGRIRVAIGRAPDYFGPGGLQSATGELFFGAAVADKTVRWLARTDVPHSLGYLPDMGDAYVTLGTDERALGRAWHVPTIAAVTGQELAAATGAVLGRAVKLSATGRTILRLMGLFNGNLRETAEMIYQWEAPFVVSDEAFRTTFAPGPATTLDDAVATTVAWFQERQAAA